MSDKLDPISKLHRKLYRKFSKYGYQLLGTQIFESHAILTRGCVKFNGSKEAIYDNYSSESPRISYNYNSTSHSFGLGYYGTSCYSLDNIYGIFYPDIHFNSFTSVGRMGVCVVPSAIQLSEFLRNPELSDESIRMAVTVAKSSNTNNPSVSLRTARRELCMKTDVKYMLANAYAELYAQPISYDLPTDKLSYKSPYQIKDNKYSLAKIDKETMQKFMRIGKYFNEVKDLLKLNEKTGFYTYHVDSIDVPIICKHEYMTYDNVDPVKISIECYKDGKCKYCKSELIAYHEVMDDLLPTALYNLMYKYIESINTNVNEIAILNILYGFVTDCIKDEIKAGNNDLSSDDNLKAAYCAVLLYNLYLFSEKDIVYDQTKWNMFLDIAKKYWSEQGFSLKDIENIVKNDPHLKEMIMTVVNSIRGRIYTSDDDVFQISPLSVLWGKIIKGDDPEALKSLQPTNELQTLWKTGKMENLNKSIIETYMSTLKSKNVYNIIDKTKDIKINSSLCKIIIQPSKSGKEFFDKQWKSYCPAWIMHEWTGGKCKHCGIDKGGKNIDEIYKKYKNIINESYIQNPEMVDPKKLKTTSSFDISKITSWNSENIEKKIFEYNGNESVEKKLIRDQIHKKILNNLGDITYYDSIKHVFGIYMNIDPHQLDMIKTEKDLRSFLNWVLDNKLMSAEEIVFQLASIYLDMSNIKVMFVGGGKDKSGNVIRKVDFDALYKEMERKKRYAFDCISRWDDNFNDDMLNELAEEMQLNGGMLNRDVKYEWDF